MQFFSPCRANKPLHTPAPKIYKQIEEMPKTTTGQKVISLTRTNTHKNTPSPSALPFLPSQSPAQSNTRTHTQKKQVDIALAVLRIGLANDDFSLVERCVGLVLRALLSVWDCLNSLTSEYPARCRKPRSTVRREGIGKGGENTL